MSRSLESRVSVMKDLQSNLEDCIFGKFLAEVLVIMGVFFCFVGLGVLGTILGCVGLSTLVICSVNERDYEKKLFVEQYSAIDEVLEIKKDELSKENSLEGLKKIRRDIDDICEVVEPFEKIKVTSLRKKVRRLYRDVDEKISDLKSFNLLEKTREDNGLHGEKVEVQPEISNNKGKSAKISDEMGLSA